MEALLEKGVIRSVTVVSVAARDPVQLGQTVTYVCTALGVAVAKLLG
jgi:hypothetical protein